MLSPVAIYLPWDCRHHWNGKFIGGVALININVRKDVTQFSIADKYTGGQFAASFVDSCK
jgi:hypothetical protein